MTTPKRRWFAFGLRTLFVVVPVVAVALWISLEWPVVEQVTVDYAGPYDSGGKVVPGGTEELKYSTSTLYRPPTPSETVARSFVLLGGTGALWAIMTLAKRYKADRR